MKIQSRLIGSIMPLIIILFITISLVSLRHFTRAMEGQIRENRNLLSRSYASRFDGILSQYSYMAQDLGSETVTAIHIESTLQNFRKRYPQFSYAFYTPLDGMVLESAPYEAELQGFDFTTYPMWSEAVVDKATFLSGAGPFRGDPSLLFFSPVLMSYIHGREPQSQGVVVLVLPLKELFRELDNSPVEENVNLFVSDSSGTFLYLKDRGNFSPSGIKEMSRKVSLGPVVQAMEEGRSGFATFGKSREKRYVSFSSLSAVPWSLGFIGEYSGITGELQNTIRINGIIILVGLALGSLVLYFIVHSVVKPIEALTSVAQKIAGGDRTVLSEVHSSSEVGVLSQAMNSMIYELRHSQRKLEETVVEKTVDLKRANEELNSTVEELNASNMSLNNIRNNLEQLAEERSGELKDAHTYIDNIINSMPSVLIGIDPRGVITQWNKEAERTFGITAGLAVGTLLEEGVPFLADHREKIREAIEQKELYLIPRRRTEVDGRIRFEEITLFPLVSNGISGAVIRIDDITERVEMEESLRQSQKMEGIGQLSSGIAHDFNNMLGGIMGGAELLKGHIKDDEKAEKYLSLIVESVENASDLTRKLLSFSRKGANVFAPLDIHETLRNTLSLLERTLQKRVELKTDFTAAQSVVMGDQSQLQNAFLNLGINADHAMSGGGTLTLLTKEREIREERRDDFSAELEPGAYIEVTVKDTGEGISEENLAKIFEPFFTTKEQGKGTGLGLSAVYNTVRQHKGDIDVISRPGEGTEFRIMLPLSAEIIKVEKDRGGMIMGTGRILVAEDEPILRKSVEEILKKLGYEVFLAGNGQEALDLFLREQMRLDLVLLDMIMPVMDGKDCFHKIKEAAPHMPIVMASGFSRESDVDDLYAEGLAAFLHKPYKSQELSRIIAGILNP